MSSPHDQIRLLFYFPLLQKTFELKLCTKVSLEDMEAYIASLLSRELQEVQCIQKSTLYYVVDQKRFLDKNVTIANLHLEDGLRIMVF